MNAFASGYSEKLAMVAVTKGLLYKLDRSELGVMMAHELSHIRHMDIKLTLMASVLANILLIAVDILFFSAMYGGRSQESGERRNRLFIFIALLEATFNGYFNAIPQSHTGIPTNFLRKPPASRLYF